MQALLTTAARAPRAVSAASMKDLVMLGVADDADLASPVLHVGDRYAVVARTAQEVVGAVDRIDDPQIRIGAGEARRGFLPEKSIPGKLALDLGANQRFNRAIGMTDEILSTFGLDRQRAPPNEIVVCKRPAFAATACATA